MIAYSQSTLREVADLIAEASKMLDGLFNVAMFGGLSAEDRADIESIPGIEHITCDLANALRAVANKEDAE